MIPQRCEAAEPENVLYSSLGALIVKRRRVYLAAGRTGSRFPLSLRFRRHGLTDKNNQGVKRRRRSARTRREPPTYLLRGLIFLSRLEHDLDATILLLLELLIQLGPLGKGSGVGYQVIETERV